jgi:hypothetical protein
MSESEVKELMTVLEDFRKKVTKNKKSSTKFLQDIGILNNLGEVKPEYQDICIPRSQA